MYNWDFFAHKILCTASQHIGLSVKCKIMYVNCAANWRSGRFRLFSLDIWFSNCCSRGVTYIHPSSQTDRKLDKQLYRPSKLRLSVNKDWCHESKLSLLLLILVLAIYVGSSCWICKCSFPFWVILVWSLSSFDFRHNAWNVYHLCGILFRNAFTILGSLAIVNAGELINFSMFSPSLFRYCGCSCISSLRQFLS
jgi:hypothetical protein